MMSSYNYRRLYWRRRVRRAVLLYGFLASVWHVQAWIVPPSGTTATLVRWSENSNDGGGAGVRRNRLQDCVCLVTGASRGIGKGIAIALGQQGAIVYVTGTTTQATSRSSTASTDQYASVGEDGPGTIEATAAAVTQAGGHGVAVYCNHAVDAHVQAVVDRIQREYGRLDLLVNNAFRLPRAGVATMQRKFWEQTIDTWDAMHTVGLRSHYVTTVLAMPLLLAAARPTNESSRRVLMMPRPCIVMIGSFGGISYSFSVAYGVGKAGVDRLAKDMAVDLQGHNITVVSLWPGIVDTERTQASVQNGDWDRYVGLPLEQAESPEFTGRAIVEIATDVRNDALTGRYHVVAELAARYGFTDVNGRRPPSIRSLQFLLPTYAFDNATRAAVPSWLIPDWKLPFWIMAGGAPPPPTPTHAGMK